MTLSLKNRLLKLEARTSPADRFLNVTIALAGEYRGVHYSISQSPIKARIFDGPQFNARRLLTSKRTFNSNDDARLSVERYIDNNYQAIQGRIGGYQ